MPEREPESDDAVRRLWDGNAEVWARHVRATGVDLSTRMIERARAEEKRAPPGVRCEVASVTDMPMLDDDSFDAVVSMMAPMDWLDYEGGLWELHLALRGRSREQPDADA